MTGMLRTAHRPWPWIAALADAPGIAPIAASAYRLVPQPLPTTRIRARLRRVISMSTATDDSSRSGGVSPSRPGPGPVMFDQR